jgi:hypothetical protein
MFDPRESPGPTDQEIEQRFRKIFDRDMSPQERLQFFILAPPLKKGDDPAT